MRLKYAIIGIALLAALLLLNFAARAQSSSIAQTNITLAINQTESYINTVNQSGYVIFYPNLTDAYKYLSLAKNESAINLPYSYSLLAQARESAEEQEMHIYAYRRISLYFLATLAVLLAILVYVLIKPYKRRKKPKNGK